MHLGYRRPGRTVWVGALALLAAAITSGAADEVVIDSDTQTAASGSGSGGIGESAEQVATEILRLRELVGSAWRGDAVAGPAESELPRDENEVLRTALVAQARAASSSRKLESCPFPSSQKTALREAAYQLDLTAHALECQDLYEQADQLRAVAQQLRQQARGEHQPVLLQRHSQLFRPVEETPAD